MKIEIDTEDEQSMGTLHNAFITYRNQVTGGATLKKVLEQAFTPLVPEPTLLGTLVRDATGLVVIKSWTEGEYDTAPWNRVSETFETFRWEELAHPIEILAEGIPSHVWVDQ